MRRKTPGFAIWGGAATMLLLVIAVSSGGAADVKKTVGSDKATAAEKIQPAAAVAGASVYQYNPRGKADPFKPFMETDIAVINKKAESLKKRVEAASSKAISPLQKEDIDQFLLVGIAGDQSRRTAIVEDKAARRHYPVFIGTYIGKNNGRVAAILIDRVIVEEVFNSDQEKTKKQQIKRIEMFLHKDR